MKTNSILFILLITSFHLIQAKDKPYEPNWNSLARHETPQWLKDAKFGIYTHVSLQTILNIEGNENKFKHEVIDDFKLEKFDAAEWVELFQRAGAKFAGPVALHGSGMLHWDSDLTEMDTVDRGPRIDLVGELKKELYKRDMKLITSFHNGYWYQAAIDKDNPGRKDPKYYDLYGEFHDQDAEDVVPWKNHIEKQQKFSEKHMQELIAKLNEAVTKYQPDIAWMDTSWGGTVRAHNKERFKHGKLLDHEEIYFNGISERYQRRYIAHLFNTAMKHNKEVEIVYKEHDIPPGIGMRNFENGLIDELTYDTWMTDINMRNKGDWFHKEGMEYKDANLLVDMLIDVTAKNGILLLNVPPKPDGTFADYLVRELHEIGDWLALNGEAIYGTMPWTVYGEGPSFLEKTGHYSEGKPNASYTEKDFRFTQNGLNLYAICMGIPEGEITISALGSRGRLFEGEILSVELLGSNKKIEYTQEPMGLLLKMPENFIGDYACVFKIVRAE